MKRDTHRVDDEISTSFCSEVDRSRLQALATTGFQPARTPYPRAPGPGTLFANVPEKRQFRSDAHVVTGPHL